MQRWRREEEEGGRGESARRGKRLRLVKMGKLERKEERNESFPNFGKKTQIQVKNSKSFENMNFSGHFIGLAYFVHLLV